MNPTTTPPVVGAAGGEGERGEGRRRKRIQRLLVANRGEIAVRIFRTCRELGITCLAIYSEADAHALHVQAADEAYCVGPAPSSASYLRADTILAIAHQARACAIHPGYGFLSENAAFAQAVLDHGFLWVGPPPAAIAAMGSKIAAKQLLQRVGGIPLIPGSAQPIARADAILEEATRLGFPVLLKASAGGGGKGMRVVHSPHDLPDALREAQREARTSFGDDAMLLEKYFERVKHIEVQLVGDQAGQVTHLYERECSVQRRHQKVLEEAPAVCLSEAVRAKLWAVAEAIGRAIGYASLGTVEFIYEPHTARFYFLEVNTRLQVEHPVTEAITGLDLVALQLRLAEGATLDALGLLPEQRGERGGPQGHALECRLCAEEPANQFFPATGRVQVWAPGGGRQHARDIRYDSAIRTGSHVSVFYDSLLAKLIVWAPDRPTAIQRMQETLRATVLLGVASNSAFLLQVLAHPEFQAPALFTTQLLDTHFPPAQLAADRHALWAQAQEEMVPAVVLGDWLRRHQARTLLRHVPSGWRNNATRPQQAYWLPSLNAPGEVSSVRVAMECLHAPPSGVGAVCRIQVGEGKPFRVWEIIQHEGDRLSLVCREDNKEEKKEKKKEEEEKEKEKAQGMKPPPQQMHVTVHGDDEDATCWHVHGYRWGAWTLHRQSALMYHAQAAEEEEEDGGDMVAPMPARVLEIAVQDGVEVEEGQLILVVESMKMQNSYRAPRAGVLRLFVRPDQLVPARTLLASILPPGDLQGEGEERRT